MIRRLVFFFIVCLLGCDDTFARGTGEGLPELSEVKKRFYSPIYSLYKENPGAFMALATGERVGLYFASTAGMSKLLRMQLGNAKALAAGPQRLPSGVIQWWIAKNPGLAGRVASSTCDHGITTGVYSFVDSGKYPISTGLSLGALGGVMTPFCYLIQARTISVDQWLLGRLNAPRSYAEIMRNDWRFLFRGAGPKIVGDTASWLVFFKLWQGYQKHEQGAGTFSWQHLLLYASLVTAAETFCTLPLSNIRTTMQKDAQLNLSFRQTGYKMYQEAGWRAFVRGWQVSILLSTLWNTHDFVYLSLVQPLQKSGDMRKRDKDVS